MNHMKNQTLRGMSLLAVAALSIGLPARAQDSANANSTGTLSAPPVAAQDQNPWRFGVTVPAWAPAIDGNVTIQGHRQDVNVSFSRLRDHLDAAFSMGFDASKGKFDIYSDVGYMKFSGGFTGPNGGNTSTDLKFVIADAGLSYLLVKCGEERPFVLAGTAGVRYWYIDTSLTFRDAAGTVNFDGSKTRDLAQPVIGLRGSQYLTRKFHLDFSGDVGGFDINNDTDITWSATGVLTYDFCKWFSLSAGYKALAIDESNGNGAGKNGLNLIFNGALIAAQFKF